MVSTNREVVVWVLHGERKTILKIINKRENKTKYLVPLAIIAGNYADII